MFINLNILPIACIHRIIVENKIICKYKLTHRVSKLRSLIQLYFKFYGV